MDSRSLVVTCAVLSGQANQNTKNANAQRKLMGATPDAFTEERMMRIYMQDSAHSAKQLPTLKSDLCLVQANIRPHLNVEAKPNEQQKRYSACLDSLGRIFAIMDTYGYAASGQAFAPFQVAVPLMCAVLLQRASLSIDSLDRRRLSDPELALDEFARNYNPKIFSNKDQAYAAMRLQYAAGDLHQIFCGQPIDLDTAAAQESYVRILLATQEKHEHRAASSF